MMFSDNDKGKSDASYVANFLLSIVYVVRSITIKVVDVQQSTKESLLVKEFDSTPKLWGGPR